MTGIHPRTTRTRLSGFVLYLDDIEAVLPFFRVLADKITPEQHGQGPKHYHLQIGETYVELYPSDSERKTNRLRIELRCADLQKIKSALIAAGGILRQDGAIVSPDGLVVLDIH